LRWKKIYNKEREMHPQLTNMLPQTTEPAGGGAGDPPKTTPDQKTWDTILAGLPEDVRKLYEEHTNGLKSALSSEREKSKGVAAQLKKLADLEAAEQKRREAELNEAQKAQAQLAELEKKLNEANLNLVTERLRNAVQSEAAKMGFLNPEDAYQLADLAEVETTDDGKVTGVEDALKKLVKDRPYLLKTPGQTTAPQTDASRRGPATSSTTNADILARKRAEYSRL
jgi:hypothetical protein